MQTTLETITPVIIPNFLGRTAGKDFEAICIYRMQIEKEAKRAAMNRYGVQASYTYDSNRHNGNIDYTAVANSAGVNPQQAKSILDYFGPQKNNGMIWQPLQSFPDFEGSLMGGHHFIFDCKVCSDASFPLVSSTTQDRQLRHMKERAEFKDICFYLIHFNARQLITKSSPARTIAFQIRTDHPFWKAHERGEIKRISEQDAELYGIRVEWNIAPGKRKASPDILAAIMAMKS